MKTQPFLFLAFALGLALAGCTAPNGDDDGEDVTVVEMVGGNAFSPDNLTVEAGTTVQWRNVDTTVHNVVADGGDWGMEDSDLLDPGERFTHTFTEPGTYPYYCMPHQGQGMTGTIIVTEATGDEDADDTTV